MFHALLLAVALTTSPVPTPFASTTVPISAQQASQSSMAQTTANAAVTGGALSTDDDTNTTPNATLPQTGVGWLFEKMGSSATSELGPIMNMSIATAQYIFRYVAAISLIINLLSLMGQGQDFPTVIIAAFRKMVEWSFLLILIMTTWSTPGGGPGWFPAIVGGIINIGIQIAQQIAPAGTPLPAQVNGTLNSLAAYPGTVADFGARLYTNINSSAPPDNYFQNIPVLGFAASLTSGAIHLGYWLAAVYAYANCLYVALRYFMMFIRALMVGMFQFLQGMNASHRLSAVGSGMYTAPIIVGCEFAAGTILVGIAMLLVEQLSYSYKLCSSLGVDPTGAGCGLIASGLPTSALASIGDLVELGVALTAWTYAMRTIPTWIADTIAGKISVNMQEVAQHFSASPMPGSGYIGSGMNTLSSTAEGGVLAGAKTAWDSTPIASFGRSAAVGAIAGASGSALKGAIGGLLMGGPEGAVAGAVVGAVSGAMKGNKKAETAESDEDPSTVESGDSTVERQDEAEMNAEDNTAEATMRGGGTIQSGGAQASASPSPFSSEGTPGTNGAAVNGNTVRSASGTNTGVPGSSDSTRTVTETTNVEERVQHTGSSDAGDGTAAHDSQKTATQTTNVKQATTSTPSADDVMKALQGLSAALNANTTAMQNGGSRGGGSSSSASAGGDATAEPGGSGRSGGLSGIAREMNMDMSLGGMLMRQALYRQARTPTPPPPPPHEESTSIGGLTMGINV